MAPRLHPVNPTTPRVLKTIAGLRPFRPSGFRVAAERLGRTLVVHNYGHGGCGVTLSWGTAAHAVDLACEASPRRAAVLGAGAVGLATARTLQQRGVHVTIYARDVPPNTTSDVAGALWSPVTLVDEDRATPEFAWELATAARASRRIFERMCGEPYGVKWLTLYLVGASPEPPRSWEWSVTPELFRPTTLSAGEHPFPSPFAHAYRLMLIEPAVYLPAVMAEFRAAGGRLIVTSIQSREDVMRLEEDVAVNCTGLGSRSLFDDEELVPIKGQLTILEPQPEVNYAIKAADEDLYMFPRQDGVVLGGSHERGEWSLAPDPQHAQRILTQHQRFFGKMPRWNR
jgi:D-amino-acid oxidase